MSSEKRIDVTALGELLIDFTQNGISEQGNGMFEANPGGAPCNVLAMLNKAGKKTAFIGKVGNDMFGRLLKARTEEQGIKKKGKSLSKRALKTRHDVMDRRAWWDRRSECECSSSPLGLTTALPSPPLGHGACLLLLIPCTDPSLPSGWEEGES